MLPDVGTSISVHEGIVDTSEQAILDETPKRIARRRRSIEEKRRIVEETLEAGASVARVARRHAVNANQVFYWRKKYREGRLGKRQSSKLLPVTLSGISSGRAACTSSPFAVGSMEIKLAKGTLRVAGNVDVVVLRTAIECLLG
jgi:transposase